MREVPSGQRLQGEHAAAVRAVVSPRRAAQGDARQGLPELPHRRQVGGAALRSRHEDQVAARRQPQGRLVRGLPRAARLRQQPRQEHHLLQLPLEGRRARRASSARTARTATRPTARSASTTTIPTTATGRSRASTARSSATTAISRSTSSRRRASAAAATASPTCIAGSSGRCAGRATSRDDWKIIHTGHDVPTPKFAGAHDRVPCVSCHPGGRLLGGTGNLCITCHRNDDIHHNVLGPNCGECHTQRTWAGAHFEHTRVGCELIGVHRMLPCVDCHIGGNFTALATNCAACHRKDAIRGDAATCARRRARCRARTRRSRSARTATTRSSSGRRDGDAGARASRCADEAALARRARCCLLPSLARAQDLKDRFNIRLIAQGMYEAEQQATSTPGYGREAQVVVAVRARLRRLARGHRRAAAAGQLRSAPRRARAHHRAVLDRRGDAGRRSDHRARLSRRARVRGALRRGCGGAARTSTSASAAWSSARPTRSGSTARGCGGAWRSIGTLSLYAGAYPDPYSRSLTSDYTGGFAFAGGVDTTYTYDKIWGSLSVTSSYLGGNNDGGPLHRTRASSRKETPRTWITWTDYMRLFSWFDLFTDLVVDATGAGGAQLTRLDALATIRAGKHLTLHAGYDHLSAFAIEMWLTRLLNDRTNVHRPAPSRTTSSSSAPRATRRAATPPSTSARRRSYAEGRFRKRALITLSDDPQFQGINGSSITPGTGLRSHLRCARPRLAGRRSRRAVGPRTSADYRSQAASSSASISGAAFSTSG